MDKDCSGQAVHAVAGQVERGVRPQDALPWRADLSGNYPNPRIVDAEGKAVGFAVQRDDWKPGDGITRDVAEARALLMAKAPQMMAALQEADMMMGHGDAETEWRERWACLWPNVEIEPHLPAQEQR